jgi:hypothetical protein
MQPRIAKQFMRAFYRLLILNLVVMATLIVAVRLHMAKKNSTVHSTALALTFLGLPVANYAIMRKIARQRGTTTLDLDIGLWASWIGGPFLTAMIPVLVIIGIIERDWGNILIAAGMLYSSGSALTTVRKAEEDGWVKIDPNGPKSFSEALRS